MIAALVLILGIAAVTADCLEVRQPAIFNLHLLFGISLWFAVGGCLLRQRRVSDFESSIRYHEYARQLSRWVYLLVYLLAGVRLAFHLGEILNLSNAGHGSGPAHAPRSLDDFRIYIAYALAPLWTLRLLILYLPCDDSRRSARRG